MRKHPETGKLSGYYRLVESYLNTDNRICHRTILNIAFMEDVTPEQLNKIQKRLTVKYDHKQFLFEREENDPVVQKIGETYDSALLLPRSWIIVPLERLSRMINTDTLRHNNVIEIGSGVIML